MSTLSLKASAFLGLSIVGALVVRISYHIYSILFPDRQAVKDVNAFYERYQHLIARVELRPNRWLAVFHSPTDAHVNKEEAKPMCIFIHGACARMGQFEHQIAHILEQGYPVVAMDNYGCGRSDKPKENARQAYAMEELIEDIRVLVARYTDDYERSFVLIGHSFGSAVALSLESSTKAQGLMLIGPPYPKMGNELKVFNMPPVLFLFLRPAFGSAFRSRALSPATNNPRLVAQERESSSRNPVHMILPFYQQLRFEVLADALQKHNYAHPAWVVCGKDDKITPPSTAENVHEALQLIDGGTKRLVILKDTGHQCMQEKPTEFNALLDEFLGQCVRTGGQRIEAGPGEKHSTAARKRVK